MTSITRTWGIGIAAVLALVAGALLMRRMHDIDQPDTQPVAAAPGLAARDVATEPAPPAERVEPETDPTPTDERLPTVMPLNEANLERFQAANSQSVEASLKQGLPYSVAASRAVCESIRSLGHDPDATLLAWMSPGFADEMRAADPAGAVSTLRTIDNLLNVALGVGASEQDRAVILSAFSPDVRALASQRP